MTATRVGNSGTNSDNFVTLSFFEALFLFADKDAKGELVVDDLETLFQVRCQQEGRIASPRLGGGEALRAESQH